MTRAGRQAWLLGVAAALAAIVAAVVAPEARAQAPTVEPKRPLIFVPGLLGSRLCRDNPANPSQPVLVWGTLGALSHFPTIRFAATDGIKPCGLVREIVYLGLFTQDVYAPALAHLGWIGYREGKDLFVFDYDWRRSVFNNADKLDDFIRAKAGTQRVDILAHSMGGLVARVYASKTRGTQIARLFSAGTPFYGSVKVYETIEKGWGAVNLLMGGLPAFRRTMLSFPSIYELMPRYAACCEGTASASAFVPTSGQGWSALGWEGVEAAAMPDLAATFARVRALAAIVENPLPPGVEDVLLIGVDQRTPQHAAIVQGRGAARLHVQTSWAGDGTVVRESAAIPKAAFHPTSFADHERLLHDPQIQDFLRVALDAGVAEAMRVVPVRPRGNIRAADGRSTELVGIVVLPDEPAYRAGDRARVHVHVRLGEQRMLSADAIRLRTHMPDGREEPVALRPDPAASDPDNPFEQSFTGQFSAGARAGTGLLIATVRLDGAQPRVIERPVAILAP